MHWVIFGVGNFLADILDALDSNNDNASEIVINQDIDNAILDCCPSCVRITPIDSYQLDPTAHHIFGFINSNKKPFLEQLKKYDITFSNLIHHKAYIAKSAKLGMGNYVGPGCVIGPGVEIGNFNYLNRCSSIGHNTIMGSFNHIGPGATICGRCNIGDRNYIGAASCLRDGITINKNITLGMGAAAVNDIIEPGTYIGIPAKRIKS